ncbi:MAG: Fic family protein [Propionibacteriaceae bacterium]|jgi:cell filamentation protein|nr:Fic family protein [Propionibacteriaceae bacterium]
MGSSDFVDPYLDPATGILKNLVGASAQAELDRIEGDLVPIRALRLAVEPPKPTGDLAELRAIHRFLFSPIYGWAGELRTVDIRKNVEGSGYFVPVSMIERAAGFATDELRADDYLRGMDRTTFITRLAHHYDQFNYIHPFREGNGRTQRWMWDRIARQAGWRLGWIGVTGAVNDAASRAAAEECDLNPLITMLDRVVVPL